MIVIERSLVIRGSVICGSAVIVGTGSGMIGDGVSDIIERTGAGVIIGSVAIEEIISIVVGDVGVIDSVIIVNIVSVVLGVAGSAVILETDPVATEESALIGVGYVEVINPVVTGRTGSAIVGVGGLIVTEVSGSGIFRETNSVGSEGPQSVSFHPGNSLNRLWVC